MAEISRSVQCVLHFKANCSRNTRGAEWATGRGGDEGTWIVPKAERHLTKRTQAVGVKAGLQF